MPPADPLRDTLVERFQRWALRTRAPEPTPIRLVSKRVYVLPTRAGLGFAAALVVLYLGAINYTLSLGHALVYLLMGLGLAAILVTFRNLAHLDIRLGHCPPCIAGDVARFGLVIHNPSRLPRYRLRFTHRNAAADTWLDTLPAQDSVEVELPVPAPRRGLIDLPRITLETRFPLGLIRTWAYLEPAMQGIVYPRPATEAPPPPGHGAGDQARARVPGDEDFDDLRRYRPGDPLAHVAWKAAARQAEAPLLTKQFASPQGEENRFAWNDLSHLPDPEQRLSILARWVSDACADDRPWGLTLPGATLPMARGAAHYHRCMEALARHGLD